MLDSIKKLIPNKKKDDDGALIVGGNQSARTYKSSATESVMNVDDALKARGNQSARTYKSTATERSLMNRYVGGVGVFIPERTKTTYTASVIKK